ncbi:MAG: hypothetical protein IKD70_01030 [Eggerthellaceae bacterium]|nr:hypothetical protein [Eggerthellaceae bacterium]
MKRFAILLAGIMLAAAGLAALPATALADDLEVAILTEEAQAYYADGSFKFDIQVKVTNNAGAPIRDFEWDCNGARQSGLTLDTEGATLTITLQASKDQVGYPVDVAFFAFGQLFDAYGAYVKPLSAVAEGAVNLKPIALTADDVTLSWTEKVYSGSSQVPDVKYKGLTLTPDEDYTAVLYLNGGTVGSAVDAGGYTLKITGDNAFEGTVEKTFTIKNPPLAVEILTEKVEVIGPGDRAWIELKFTNNTDSDLDDCYLVYSADDHSNDALVGALTPGETGFSAGIQVTEEQITAGKVSVSASVSAQDEGGSTVSSATVSRDITVILVKPISGCTITLSEYSYGYDGTSHVPTVVSVKDGDATLTAGEDYEVEFRHDGNKVDEAVNAGDYTVCIKGKGRYYGTVDKTFTIDPRPVAKLQIVVVEPVEYAGSPVTPEVTVKDGEKVLTLGTDYTLSCVNNDGPGTGILIVNGLGNYVGEVKEDFVIIAPAPTYSLTIAFTLDPAATEYRYGDRITWMATVTNTGTGTVNLVGTCGLDPGNTWPVSDLDAGEEMHYSSQPYYVTYADVEAGMITTAGGATATGPNGEEVPVTITITDATAKVIPTPTTITLDLGQGTLDGKTGKVTIDANVGQPYQLPTEPPVLDGYTFQFYRGSEYYPGDTYIVEADHTLTAVYKKNQPTIPDTGDATPLALVSALALMVAAGGAVALARKRG